MRGRPAPASTSAQTRLCRDYHGAHAYGRKFHRCADVSPTHRSHSPAALAHARVPAAPGMPWIALALDALACACTTANPAFCDQDIDCGPDRSCDLLTRECVDAADSCESRPDECSGTTPIFDVEDASAAPV